MESLQRKQLLFKNIKQGKSNRRVLIVVDINTQYLKDSKSPQITLLTECNFYLKSQHVLSHT